MSAQPQHAQHFAIHGLREFATLEILASLVALLLLAGTFSDQLSAETRVFRTSERFSLGTELNRSASVRVADIDNDHDLDIVTANGRHWPQANFLFLNQGGARFSVQRKLGGDRSTSYAAELADLDGDGDLDLAVGNDMAPNQIFFNAGDGRFTEGGTFGAVSSVRSLTLVDIDSDGDVDVLTTCRSKQNYIYLNRGNGRFESGIPFGEERDSTIDVATVDWNGDGHLDLLLARRDEQPNAILLNDGKTGFEKEEILFGSKAEPTRAVAAADLNGDSHPDIVVANIGHPNRVYLGNGRGGVADEISFGRPDGRSYTLAIADVDNDQDLDVIIGNTSQPNAVWLNDGSGANYAEVRFGKPTAATYGVDTGDLDGDGFVDIVVANSDALNHVFLNRPAAVASPSRTQSPQPARPARSAAPPEGNSAADDGDATDWPSFRGKDARGVADGRPLPTSWNADPSAGDVTGVLWETEIPGLGHSSPVVSGDRVLLATAIAAAGEAPLTVKGGGRPTAADDNGEQSWVVLCYDRLTGKELWRKTAHRGVPRATRHAKATHANTSIAVDGDNVVAFFGSEGIHCFSLDGEHKWSRDLGVINISKYGIGWGYASSPAIRDGRIAIVCDDPAKPFVAALSLTDGKELWRTSRKDDCVRSWSTPFIHSSPSRRQVVVNGWPWIVSYDMTSGAELWRIRGGGDNPVPTPFAANGWIYITNAHGAESPIFVVRPDASGDVTPPEDTGSNKEVVWSTRRGGSYMSTPVVYGDYLYLGNTNGVVRCFHARTGEKVYEKRLDSRAAITSSLVAGDGKIFCPSENGEIYVLKAGPKFEVLAKNSMGAPCLASPAIARGVLYVRTTKRLAAIK